MILNTSLTLCMEIVFPGGGGSGRSPFESADPVERVGRWKYSSIERRIMKSSTVEQLGGRGAGGQNRYSSSSHPFSVVYWCKVKDSCEDPSSGQGAESHEIMQKIV